MLSTQKNIKGAKEQKINNITIIIIIIKVSDTKEFEQLSFVKIMFIY